MLATTKRPAGANSLFRRINNPSKSRFYDFSTRVRYTVVTVLYLFYKPVLRHLSELPGYVCPRVRQVLREDSRGEEFERVTRRKRLQKAVLRSRHGVRLPPDTHNVFHGHDLVISCYCICHNTAIPNHGFVISFITLAQRGYSNDSPGVLGGRKSPGRAWTRSDPVGRLTAMSENEPSGLKARTETVESHGIEFDASATLRGAYDAVRLEVTQ